MKNSIITVTVVVCMTAAALIATSCVDVDKKSYTIKLSAMTGRQTKLSGASEEDESRLNSIVFYVFDESGTIEASTLWSEDTGASCEVKNGMKKIYAVVNCFLESMPASEDELLSTLSFIYDNSPDNLIMSGCAEEEIDGDKNIRIQVRRHVGKVVIEEIKLAMKDGARTGITINSIFLTNVNSSISFDGKEAAESENWINKAGYSTSDADSLTYEPLETYVPNNSSHDVHHTFYAYPNPTSEDSHSVDVFCARFTRLVIDTDYGFYRLDIPGLSGNHSYIFKSVTITNEGSSDPEADDEKGDCEVVLVIDEWENGGARIERI